MKAQQSGGAFASKNQKRLLIEAPCHFKKLFVAMSGVLITSVCLQSTVFAASKKNESLQQQVNQLQREIKNLNKKVKSKVNRTNYSGKTKYVVGGSSYIYTDAHGPKKFEQLSSADIPLSLLKMKNDYPTKSLTLGGLFEFEPINSWFGDKLAEGNAPGKASEPYHHGTAAAISNVSFDAMINVNDYTQVFTQFSYTGGNGKISLMSGFVTFGNLQKSPFFVSVGKDRPRFGVFPGGPYYATIPQGIFRPGHLINTTVGYSHNNLDVYVAYLPTTVKNSGGVGLHKNGVMLSAFYTGKINNKVSYGFNAGYVSDVATTGSGVGVAVAAAHTGYKVVPAVDADANVTVGPFNLSGGYQTTLKKDSGVVTNSPTGEEKKASSYYTQLAYSVQLYNKPVTFAVNYSKAKNTENVAMPLAGDINSGGPTFRGIEKQLGGYALVHLNKSFAAGLEYARMKTYAGQHTDAVSLYGAIYF